MSGQIELRHLRYFVTVAEELNFRRAAERLFISQPPLSRQIRELEALVGAKLFERDTASVKLTPAGEIALKRARKLLGEASAFANDLQQKNAKRVASVRIALSVAVPAALHPALVKGWKQALNADAIELEAGESKHLLPRLKRQQFQFALLGSPNNFDGLEAEIVHTVPLVAVLPARHPAARKKTVALKDLAGTPLFWFTRKFNPAYHDHCAKVFASAGFQPAFIHVPPGQLATLERISHGEGFALLTTAQVQMEIKGVVYRPLKEGKMLGISMVGVWPANGQDKALAGRAKKFAAVAKKVLAGQ